MSQNYTWPSVSVSASNPSVGLNAAAAPASSTLVGGTNAGNLVPIAVSATGEVSTTSGSDAVLAARLGGSLTPVAFDEVILTYLGPGPGEGQVGTAVYKLATVTVKTLTLTYDGSDRLSSAIAS